MVTGSPVRSSAPSTTTSPCTSRVSTWRGGPSTSAAMGSAIPAMPASSRRHSATSASLPGSSEPSSSARPRQRAPWIVPSASASRAVMARGPPRTARVQQRGPQLSCSSPASFEAAPSTPRPTGAPAATRSAARAMPAPSRALELGQCATPVPVCAEAGHLARRSGARSGPARRRRRASPATPGTPPGGTRTAPGRTRPPRRVSAGACAAARRGGARAPPTRASARR